MCPCVLVSLCVRIVSLTGCIASISASKCNAPGQCPRLRTPATERTCPRRESEKEPTTTTTRLAGRPTELRGQMSRARNRTRSCRVRRYQRATTSGISMASITPRLTRTSTSRSIVAAAGHRQPHLLSATGPCLCLSVFSCVFVCVRARALIPCLFTYYFRMCVGCVRARARACVRVY